MSKTCRICKEPVRDEDQPLCGSCKHDRIMISAIAMAGLLASPNPRSDLAREAVRYGEALLKILHGEN